MTWPPVMWRPLYVAYRMSEMGVSLVSRFINAAIFAGSTHQTFSARCHVESIGGDPAWRRRKAFVNAMFAWQRPLLGIEDHCKWAWDREVLEARKTLRRAGLGY